MRNARAEERLAAEVAVRLGDRERVRRALDKVVRLKDVVREDGYEQQQLVLLDANGEEAFKVAEGKSLTASRVYLELVLTNFLDEVLSW